MTKNGAHIDLFDWADARRSADVIDFLDRRSRLPRWILARRGGLETAFLRLDRRLGLVPQAPIFPFKREA